MRNANLCVNLIIPYSSVKIDNFHQKQRLQAVKNISDSKKYWPML